MSVATTVKGRDYRIGTLSAMKQFHVVRRLAPVLAGLTELAQGEKDGSKPGIDLAKMDMAKIGTALEPLARQIAEMEDEAAEFIIHTCLSVVERKQSGGAYAKVVVDGQFMFEDMDMITMLTLTAKVVQGNLAGFFAALPEGIPGVTPT